MDPEAVINLFDSCWFNLEIFKNQSFSSISSKFLTNPSDQPKFSSLKSILMRSKSDELSSLSSFNYGSNSASPNSVLFTPQLQTILSGKEATLEEEEEQQQQQQQEPEKRPTRAQEETQEKPKKIPIRRTKSRGVSKSLSDLEFEELKGFMDLGFVFSEKDKDSSLVEIIPGLQRLGQEILDGANSKEQEISSVKVESNSASRRPYLSEAWNGLDRRKRENPYLNPNPKPIPMLMNWSVPALSNEVDVKDSLKLWAHSVASVVR